MTPTPPPGAIASTTVNLTVGEYRLEARISVPAGPTPLRTVLPVIQSLADGLVGIAARASEDQGKPISCTKGCGACCRQLVPISEVEARNIREVVEALPEPRRGEVRARFADARQRLAQSGLLERLERRETWSNEEFQRIGLEYFHTGIPCPFLEEESCSIHPDRPVTCREYLVTSPAANCAAPTRDNIDTVPIPVKLWREVARFDEPPPGSQYLRWVPLVLAPEWAEAHPDEGPLRPGPEWMTDFFHRIAAAGAANRPEAVTPGASSSPGA